jgi:hypothetical protein
VEELQTGEWESLAFLSLARVIDCEFKMKLRSIRTVQLIPSQAQQRNGLHVSAEYVVIIQKTTEL